MAASKTINLLVDCLICGFNRSDRNPRMLPCKHGFCQECLNKTSSMKTERQLQCPVCLQNIYLSQNGVTDLEADTKALEASAAILALKDNYTCALCIIRGKKKQAVARCTSCEFRLCDTCVEDHKKKPWSSAHVIVDKLCRIHIRDLSHACLTCRAGLCYECILSGFHDDHDICDVTEVEEKATAMIIKGTDELKQEIVCVEKIMNKTMDESMKSLNEKRKQTEEKLENHRKKMMEAIAACLDKREEEFNRSVMKGLGNQNEACSQASNCLNEMNTVLQGRQIDIREQLTEKTGNIFRSLNTLRTTKEIAIRLPEVEEDEFWSNTDDESWRSWFKCALGKINSETAAHGKPTKILELKNLSGKDKRIKKLYFIASSPDGSAVLGLAEENYAVQINRKGDIIAEFYTQSGSRVRGVDIYRGEVYILSQDALTITRFKRSERDVFCLYEGPSDPWDFAVDAGSFLITNSWDSIFRYSPEGLFQKEIDKNKGYRISVGEHSIVGRVYLVSAHKELYLYSPNGELIRAIGKAGIGRNDVEFSQISGCTMLPNNHILITDKHQDRVTEVTFHGGLVRHLLTQEDGVKAPTDISFHYPYLWISCMEAVLLFKYA